MSPLHLVVFLFAPLSPCPGSSNVRPSCPGIRACLKIAKLACYFPASSALTLYLPLRPPPPLFLSSHLSPDSSLQQRDSRKTLCLPAQPPFSFGGNTNPRQVRERLKTSLRVERLLSLCFQSRIMASGSFFSLCSLFALSSEQYDIKQRFLSQCFPTTICVFSVLSVNSTQMRNVHPLLLLFAPPFIALEISPL